MFKRRILFVQFVAMALVALTSAAASARPDRDSLACRQVATRVSLAPGQPATYRVNGTLCGRSSTVELAIHGASYSRTYWFGPGPDRYDYVASQVRTGYAVLAVDMPGAGTSDKPDPSLLTFTSLAHVVHQLAQQLRTGPLGHYRTVVGVGHSMGAGELQVDAGTPEGARDFDGLILADFLHDANQAAVAQAQALYTQVPGMAPGYITVYDRTFFYNTDYAQPSVIAWDTPTSFSISQARTLGFGRDPSYTRAISVSPLIVVGQDDALGCSPALPCDRAAQIVQRERGYYTVPVRAMVLPRSGHDTNLHPDAPAWFAAAAGYVRGCVRR